LTGLANRRAFFQWARREISRLCGMHRSQRSQEDLGGSRYASGPSRDSGILGNESILQPAFSQ
jgi:hypothetical protein